MYDKEPLSCNGQSDENISELVEKHKWSCYSSFTSLNTFTKQQGCKEPCKIKDNVTIFGIFKISITVKRQFPK